jgi:prepilin-type N-terminal cleavage/methylation domain-containing protein
MKNTKGMTLVEMIIAIAILLIGMEGFALLFLRSWQSNAFILEEGLASAAASRAVSRVVGELRRVRQADNGDFAVEAGDDYDLTVYIDIDNDNESERVHYYLDDANDEFKRGVTEPNHGSYPPTYPSGDQATTTLVEYAVNTAAQPLFTYYTKDYPTTPTPLTTPIVVGDTHLIQIQLWVNIDPIKAPNNINIQSFVELRNLHPYE